jgi:radical SAM protein with 4Fe4S-binding SPASM domain
MGAPFRFRCPDAEGGRLTGNALLDAAWEWAYRNEVPLTATLELTRACNLRCVHCYNRDRCRTDGGTPDPGELSLDEVYRVVEALRHAGCLSVGLTGGEPLAHPRVFDVLDRIRDLCMAVQVLTNGTRIDASAARRLAAYNNLSGVSVSLYGATATVHDGVTGVPGSFGQVQAGVEYLRTSGVNVLLKCILMRRNRHEADALIRYAADRGCPYLVDFGLTCRHDGHAAPVAERLTPDDVEALARGPLRTLLPDGRADVSEDGFPCNCARSVCAISATGDVYPCIAVPWSAGNVRERPFAEIWRDSPVFRRIRGLRLADYPQCGPCEIKAWCFRDRGTCYLASGEYTGIDPWLCEVAAAAKRAAGG